MIKRERYVQKLAGYAWNGKVKVITGLRRSGKSTLLFVLYRSRLEADGVSPKNIIEIKLDKLEDFKYRDPFVLLDFINQRTKGSAEKFYVFIDELQFCKQVNYPGTSDKVTIYDLLNELRDRNNLDVYVTGSNSKFLSSDIATEFRGRASQIRVSSLSFAEYHNYAGGSKRDNLNEYMLFGGLPEVPFLSGREQKTEYLTALFNEVYVRDIVERYKIERTEILAELLNLLSSSTGSLTNASSIANTLCSTQKTALKSSTISTYIDHIKEAFIVSEAKRFDIKGKRYFSYPSKFYFTDLGLRNARINYRQFDKGHLMENLIYNELISRGCSVDVGVVAERSGGMTRQREIDFVVNLGDKRIYIQSAYEMKSEEKAQAELASFKLTGDFFRKVVIEMEIPSSYMDNEGILHCSLFEFLLDENSLKE